jgi:sugar O-acyltransferase (sialic acid O-acetyltransferase NeuD family)
MNVILIGASGHARSVADVINAQGRYRISGLIDSFQEPGTVCFGYEILGGEKDLPNICRDLKIYKAFTAIGDNYQRQAMTERVQEAVPGIEFIACIHPSAIVGSDVKIGAGTVIMPGVIIVSGSSIAEGCILNTSSSIDHDSIMEPWSSLGPGAIAGGRLHLGKRSAINLGAKVIHNTNIGSDTLVGAGAVVLENIPDKVIAHGVPCRVIRSRKPGENYL